MRVIGVFFVLLGASALSFGQSDLELIAFPERNSPDTIIRSEISPIGTADERSGGTRFEMIESERSMRYSLVHRERRDVYLNIDTYWASMDNDASFKESGERLPRDLYDVGVGGLLRQELDNGWTIGARLRVGSASDKLFNTADEVYLRSMLVLRVPHKEYTSWVFMAKLNTDGDFPILPGVGYAFPLSERAYALVGLPFLAAGGQLTDKLSFYFTYFPVVNIDGRLDYRLNERWTAYTGYKSQARFFSRAHREDEDDRIRLQDSRVFAGATVKVFKRWQLDGRVGYVFAREFGEGDDYDDRRDNDIRLDDAGFISGGLQIRF